MEVLRDIVCVGWWHSLLLLEDLVKIMPRLYLLVDAIDNGLVDIVVPQLEIVSLNSILLVLFAPELDCLAHREPVLEAIRSFSWL